MITKAGNWITETEYRINKKGCEYFRSDNYDQIKEMLQQLQAKRPNVFTMQSRSRQRNIKMYEYQFRPWSEWR